MAKKVWTWADVKTFVKEIYLESGHEWPPVVKKFDGKEYLLICFWDNHFLDKHEQEFKKTGKMGGECHQTVAEFAKNARQHELYARITVTEKPPSWFMGAVTSLYLRPKNVRDEDALDYILTCFDDL